ncbi:hypothetical protein [Rhizohabitans arisaemae]|nr:hypothetical protein [Rhizohabitans arisaemae]
MVATREIRLASRPAGEPSPVNIDLVAAEPLMSAPAATCLR